MFKMVERVLGKQFWNFVYVLVNWVQGRMGEKYFEVNKCVLLCNFFKNNFFEIRNEIAKILQHHLGSHVKIPNKRFLKIGQDSLQKDINEIVSKITKGSEFVCVFF